MREPVLNTDPLVEHGLPIDLLNAAALIRGQAAHGQDQQQPLPSKSR